MIRFNDLRMGIIHRQNEFIDDAAAVFGVMLLLRKPFIQNEKGNQRKCA